MSTINTHFSQKDNLQKVIIQNLNSAKSSVLIAVAWFTDTKLFNKVLEIQGRGIKVELIITKHFNEESHNDFELIRSNGGVFVEIGGDYNTRIISSVLLIIAHYCMAPSIGRKRQTKATTKHWLLSRTMSNP
ncbi:MAG: phospholipase D-like domain-containing protein [Bacteroidia bacterium]